MHDSRFGGWTPCLTKGQQIAAAEGAHQPQGMTSPQSPSGRWPFQWKRSEQRCLPREFVEQRGVTFSSLSGPNFRNHPELTNGMG